MKDDIGNQTRGTALSDDIPFWYKEGALKYFANGWPIAAEDALRISFEQRNFKSWQECISYQRRLSGQAFCYFLNEQYYPQASMQLFSQLKKKKNLARSIRLIVKKPLDSLLLECYNFYDRRFRHIDATQGGEQMAISHKKGIVRNISISPDGNNIAYVVYRKNIRYVYVYDRKSAKAGKLTQYLLPPWINDYSADIYPLLLKGEFSWRQTPSSQFDITGLFLLLYAILLKIALINYFIHFDLRCRFQKFVN